MRIVRATLGVAFALLGCVALLTAASVALAFAPLASPFMQLRPHRHEAIGIGVAAGSFVLAWIAWPRVRSAGPTSHLKLRRTIALGGALALVAAVAGFTSTGGLNADAPSVLKWMPPLGLRWQYQLQGTVNTTICTVPFAGGACVHPGVFDIDLYAANGTTLNAAAVNQIHARHAHAVCYVDAGTSEDWRPDAAKIPASLMGKSNGWPGERWLDIRKTGVLLPIIKARVQKCVQAGFDAVDFDNVDGYTNATGFPLTAANQLAFNKALAQLAHGLGLAVGLKNDIEQVVALRPNFEFAVNEQCFQYQECGVYDSWAPAGKPVLEVEYSALPKNYCPAAYAHGRAAIKKQLAMVATPWQTCR